jgi:hypothetical protein
VIAEVTRASVIAAIGEFDRCGLAASLAWHGFGPATAYELRYRGCRYPSKAVLGVAAGYQLDGEPLRAAAFSGGAEHSARRLVQLGFEVERGGEPAAARPADHRGATQAVRLQADRRALDRGVPGPQLRIIAEPAERPQAQARRKQAR